MKRLILTVVTSAALLAALIATPAQAVVLDKTQRRGIESTQIDAGGVFWAQTNLNWYYESEEQPRDRLLRRDLATGKIETVFEASDDDDITAFNAVNGRVIVGQINRIDGSSTVLEIKRDGVSVSTAVLAVRNPGHNGTTCSSRVRPIGVNSLGEAIIEELRLVSTDGNCARGLIKRTVSSITAVAADGTSRPLVERKSGWSTDERDVELGRPRWGGGDWLGLMAGGDWDGFGDGTSGMLNLATGEFVQAQLPFLSSSDLEFAKDGRSLQNEDGRGTRIAPDPHAPDKSIFLPARRSVRWMHACGDKLIEFSRRREGSIGRGTRSLPTRRVKPGGRYWYVYIRSLDGARERRLSQKLARGTNFDGCNADTAVFHKSLRHDRVRQFTVSLSPPTA